MGSLFGSINWLDVLKGFITAVAGAVIAALYTIFTAVPIVLPTLAQLGSIGLVGLAAGIGYLFKQFFSNNAGQPFKKDVPPSTTIGSLNSKV